MVFRLYSRGKLLAKGLHLFKPRKEPTVLSHLRKSRRNFIFPLLIFLATQPTVSFGPPNTSTSNTTTNQNSSSGGVPQNPAAANGVPESFQNDQTGTITPSQPPQQSDRKSGAGAAQAAAIAGAAMAGMSCMMMMNEARKMPPGKDKNMMMMMAMQQCAQAAQSAANAGKNEDAKNAVSQNDIPKQAQLTAPKQQTKSDTSPDQQIAQNTTPASEESTNVDDLAQTPTIDPNTIPSPTSLENGKPMDTGNVAVKEVSISALKPIEAAKVDFNETAKEGDKTVNPNLFSAGYGGFGGVKGISSDDLKKATDEAYGAGAGKKKKGGGGDGGAEASGMDGGGSSSKEEGGNSAFDQMLAQLMGGGAQPEQAMGMGGLDVVVLPKDKNGNGPGPNIFEYASYRYKTATFTDGRLKPKKFATKETGAPNVFLVSKP